MAAIFLLIPPFGWMTTMTMMVAVAVAVAAEGVVYSF
jgi:hypothetical protein